MRETNHRKRRRSCTPNGSNISSANGRRRDRRSSSRCSGEGSRETIKKDRHHHHHHHSHKKPHHHCREKMHIEEDGGRHRHGEDLKGDKRRNRNHTSHSLKDGMRNNEEDSVRIKSEPLDFDERVQPSSSKWDEDDRGEIKDSRDSGSRQGIPSNGYNSSRPRQHAGGPNMRPPRKKPFFKREEEDTSGMEWGKKLDTDKKPNPTVDKEKPNFGLSGKLTEDSNTYKGVVIKYSEPPEARVPKTRWRLYPFKGDEALKVIYLHRASAYLLGRDRKVVDIPLDHPSCSKQHAALQYRLVQYNRENGSSGKRIRPYVIDLESANGTFVNNNKIEPRKYVELLERDVLKFGFSSREYVLLHEHSKDENDDEDDGND